MSIIQFVKNKLFFKQILIAFVGLIVFVFVIKIVLIFSTNHNQKIEVPNLSKLSIEEATLKLSKLDLDYIVIDSASYNPDYPKFSVIEQNPEAGDFVKENVLSDELGLSELIVAPRSTYRGKKINIGRFGKKHKVQVIALNRYNKRIRGREFVLKEGDSLLVRAKWEDIRAIQDESKDFLIVGHPSSRL